MSQPGRPSDERRGDVYRLLLQHPRSSTGEIAEALGLNLDQVENLLRDLRRLVVAVNADTGVARWEAQPPVDTTDAALAEQQARLGDIRRQHKATTELSELYWRIGQNLQYDGVEVLRDQVVVLETVERLQERARHQVRCFDRPPYYSQGVPGRVAAQAEIQKKNLAAGISYRVIYEPGTWSHDFNARLALQSISHGEQARHLEDLPMKLYLIDDNRAVMPLDPAHHAEAATIVVHPSGLLRALSNIFEFYWAHAIPITHDTSAAVTATALDARDRSVLTLLAAGCNDDTIMRRTGLSRSTITRTATRLQETLNAANRFQLGAQAVRHGLI